MSLSAPLPWDLVAAAFTAHNLALFEAYAADALALVDPDPDARVLDVATGPGTLALLAAPRVGHVHAVDFSDAMLAECRTRVAAAGAPNVTVAHADGQALPFPEASFDAAFSMFGLIFFPDRAAGLRELHRVVRPGGAIALGSWAPWEGLEPMDSLFAAVFEELPELAPKQAPPPMALSSEAAIRAEVEAAGFSVDVRRVSHRADAPSMTQMVASVFASNAVLRLMAHNVGDRFAPVEGRVRTKLVDRFGDGPVGVELGALLTVGRR